MTVHIGTKHLVKSPVRKTYSDKVVPGFALRTTPQGSFTFYFQHLNKATGKRDWHLIGAHPEWEIERARNEARGLAGLVAKGQNIKAVRNQRIERTRIAGITFSQIHDEYIDYCKQPIRKRWGVKPRKESWMDIRSALKRALAQWGPMSANEITDSHVMDLYQTYVTDDHIPQGNRVRTMLHTMFKWAIQPPRKYLKTNPCSTLPEKEKAVPVNLDPKTGKKRVLSIDELRTLWFGLDDPKCPGDRLSKLALKLSLVTALRSGEVVSIERDKIETNYVTVKLEVLKGRRHEDSEDVVQPLNSLAREIIAKIFEGDEGRRYAFPGTGRRGGMWMDQKTLAHLVSRRSTDEAGKAGISEFLGMRPWTPHAVRRTSATIMKELGYSEVEIGEVLTHKPTGKESSPVTRRHYIIDTQITEAPVDRRANALDALDAALRKILGLEQTGLRLVA